MNLKKIFNSLTDSSKVLLTVGGVSLLLDFVGQGELDKKLAAGLGMLMWLGIMVYQNQCLGPRNCSNYSWLLVILLVIGMLIKMYYVNIQGLSKREFKTMLETDNNLPNNDEPFTNGTCQCGKPQCTCGEREGFTNGTCQCGKPQCTCGEREGFTNGSCQCGQTPCVCGEREGFQPIYHEDEDEEETGELFEGFSQTSTST